MTDPEPPRAAPPGDDLPSPRGDRHAFPADPRARGADPRAHGTDPNARATDALAAALAARLAALLPPGVLSAAAPCAETPLRHAAEAALIERAVDKRRREFATGRALAHELLDRLGAADAPLLPGARRAPLWPAGLVGSLAHTRARCVAAVARATDVALLGLDLEDPAPLEPDLWRRILTPTEHAWVIAAPGEDERGRRAKLVFSAKECVYKALAPVVPRVLEFGEVVLAFGPASGHFAVAILPPDVPARPQALAGRCWADEHDLLTVVTAPARAP